MEKEIHLIDAEVSVDDRGELMFCNGLDLSPIRRFYTVSNHRADFIRAWHGHKTETKYVLVLNGVALIATVQVNDWDSPDQGIVPGRFVLSESSPKALVIPGGFAHGYKTLVPNTKLLFFSTSTLEESGQDDYRFDAKFWDPWSIMER